MSLCKKMFISICVALNDVGGKAKVPLAVLNNPGDVPQLLAVYKLNIHKVVLLSCHF